MTKNDSRSAQIFSCVTVAVAAACIAAAVYALCTIGTTYVNMSVDFGSALGYLYEIGALTSLFAIIACAGVLAAKKRRENVIKIGLWGVLILSIAIVEPFLTSTIAYFQGMNFTAVFAVTARYIPYFAAIVTLVALFSIWARPSHRAANIIALVAGLVSVFSNIVMIWQIVPTMLESLAGFQVAQYWSMLFGYIVPTLVVFVVWDLTLSQRAWQTGVLGLSAEEAELEEAVCAAVDVMRPEMETRLSQLREAASTSPVPAGGEGQLAGEKLSAEAPTGKTDLSGEAGGSAEDSDFAPGHTAQEAEAVREELEGASSESEDLTVVPDAASVRSSESARVPDSEPGLPVDMSWEEKASALLDADDAETALEAAEDAVKRASDSGNAEP